jgi:hypothetical protein
LINEYGTKLGPLGPLAKKFLTEIYSLVGGGITVYNDVVIFDFVIPSEGGSYIASFNYIFDEDYTESEAKKDGTIKISSHWFYWGFAPY